MKHQKSDTGSFKCMSGWLIHTCISTISIILQRCDLNIILEGTAVAIRLSCRLTCRNGTFNFCFVFKTIATISSQRCRVNLVPIESTSIFYVQVSSTPGGRPPGIKWPLTQQPYWAIDMLTEFHRTIWEDFRQMCRFLYLFTDWQYAISSIVALFLFKCWKL